MSTYEYQGRRYSFDVKKEGFDHLVYYYVFERQYRDPIKDWEFWKRQGGKIIGRIKKTLYEIIGSIKRTPEEWCQRWGNSLDWAML